MASIITNSLRKSIAQTIFDEIFSRRSHYYYFFGKPAPGTTVSSNPSSTKEYEAFVRNNIVAAKRIYSNDVAFVVPRFDWVSGVVYDKVNVLQTGIVTQDGPKFYVYDTVNHRVYKCIDNNGGAASTVRPTSTEPFNFKTADGYTWRYMYSIPTSLRNKFLTSSYIPVYTSIQKRYYSDGGIGEVTIVKSGTGYSQPTTKITVTGDGTGAVLEPVIYNGQLGDVIVRNAGRDYTRATITVTDTGSGQGAEVVAELNVGDLDSDQALVELLTTSGTVDSIDVLTGGSEYTSNSTVRIIGDGSGATAQLQITGGVITKILVTNPGEGYTWAQAIVTPQVNPPRSGSATNVTTRVNVSPFLGHGRNAVEELHANTLMVFGSVFTDRLSDFDANTTYKQYGIIKDIRNFEYSANVYDQVSPNRYQVEADFGPEVIFTGGGGTGAKGTVNVTGRTVAQVSIEDAGSGFTTTPTISFSGGGGNITLSVKTTSGSKIATTTSTENLTIGAVLSGNANVPAGAKITSITDRTTFVLDVNATGTNTVGVNTTFSTPASAVATISAKLNQATTTLTYGGVGYSFAPSVSLSGQTGSGGSFETAISQGVGSINITNQGSGYATVPTVTISGGGGTGATAVAEVYDGKVVKVRVTNPGSGYTSTPTVAFSAGTAAATAVLTNTVSSLTVSKEGQSYEQPPIATFNGSTGISDIQVNDIGELFTTNPTITISGGGGNGATAVAYVADALRQVIVTAQGSGYTSPPTVNFSGGGGTGAAATAVISGGKVTEIVITNRGSGYTSAPTISFSGGGGSGAAASAVVSRGIVAVNITNPGTGYTSPPVITVGASGSRRGFVLTPVLGRATATVGISGSLKSVTLLNGGLNYTSTPTVTVSGGGGSGALVYAKVIGRVSSITITEPGTGYVSSPTVTITGGEGTGAVARATVSGGSVSGVIVTNGGNNYVLTTFSMFTVGSLLRDEVGNEYTVTSAKTNKKMNSLIVSSNAGFPVVGRMRLRKFGTSDYFITNTALSQKFVESRFPVACYKVTSEFDINLVPIGSVLTITDQTNGDKYYNVISVRNILGNENELLLQPTNGGDINTNAVLSNGAVNFAAKKVVKPDIDVRTGDILMISNSDVDFTQNQDQSLSFRTIINF